MTQSVVLNKLSEFLRQTDPSKNEELRKSLKAGHCSGWSICFGAMAVADKLTWWSEALRSIALWDENPATLEEKIILSGSLDNNPPTLRNIFERVLNYIVFCHVDGLLPEFRTKNIDSVNILSPSDNHFELLDANGAIKKIKKLDSAAGYFTKDHLSALIDENLLTDSICIIYNTSHCICIAYKNNQWIIYDPNYSHNGNHGIYKTAPSKNTLIDVIISIQGNSLAISVASFKDENKTSLFNNLNNIIQNDAETVVKDFGLHLIARYAPEELPILIDRLSNSNEGLYLIAKGLTTLPPYAWTGIENKYIFQTGLREIIVNASQHLPRILELATRFNKKNIDAIVKIITEHHADEWDTLSVIVRNYPQHLPIVLKLSSQSKKGPDLISTALVTKDPEGWSPLSVIVRNCPQHLPIVLKLASRSKKGPDLISKALVTKNGNGYTNLHTLAIFGSEHLPQILELAEKSNMGRDLVVASLVVIDKDGWTVLKRMGHYAPQHLSRIYEFAARSKKCPDEVALCIMTDALEKNNYDLAKLILTNANSLALQKKLIQKIVDNKNINLFTLATWLPGDFENKRILAVELIKQLIKEANNSQQVLQLIIDIEKNKQNINYIFARKGVLTTYSLHGHSWKGEEASGTWVGIINIAKQRILDLAQQDNFKNVSDDDLNFLRTKTLKRQFLTSEIDYYEKYKKLKESHSQSTSAHLFNKK